ncbi:MAG TPA: hypothetical protein VFQ61_22120 [Polyangiaceae bacterium]|nr:hypothetical protein [Polyangiaceae bacterium]
MRRSASTPGGGLIHPIALLSLVGLIVNDHYLKAAMPGVFTGKFSDVCGLVLMPLWLQTAWELWPGRGLNPTRFRATSNRILGISVGVTAIAYSAVELWSPAEFTYRYGLGAVQWPWFAITAVLERSPLPPLQPVRATADPSDLLALPALALAWYFGRSAAGKAPPNELAPKARLASCKPITGLPLLEPGLLARRLLELGSTIVCVLWATPAWAAPPQSRPSDRRHDGLFIEGGLNVGVLRLASNASISNGFQQRLRSTTWAPIFPSLTLAIGGTVAPGLVLAGEYERSSASPLWISTRNDEFQMPDLALRVQQFAAFVRYYPEPTEGLYFGGALGLIQMSVQRRSEGFGGGGLPYGHELTGIAVTPEVGIGIWLSRGYSLSGAIRPQYAHLGSDHLSAESLGLTLSAKLTWH